MIEMRKQLTETSTKKDWMELFSVKSNRKALFIVIVINCLQHGSGVMAILFFSASIFDMVGSSIDGNISLIIIMCCQLMGSTVTPFFIESTGRKKILIISSSICCLSMVSYFCYVFFVYVKPSLFLMILFFTTASCRLLPFFAKFFYLKLPNLILSKKKKNFIFSSFILIFSSGQRSPFLSLMPGHVDSFFPF